MKLHGLGNLIMEKLNVFSYLIKIKKSKKMKKLEFKGEKAWKEQ